MELEELEEQPSKKQRTAQEQEQQARRDVDASPLAAASGNLPAASLVGCVRPADVAGEGGSRDGTSAVADASSRTAVEGRAGAVGAERAGVVQGGSGAVVQVAGVGVSESVGALGQAPLPLVPSAVCSGGIALRQHLVVRGLQLQQGERPLARRR